MRFGADQGQNPHVPSGIGQLPWTPFMLGRAGACMCTSRPERAAGAGLERPRRLCRVLERIRAESDMLVNLTTSGFNLQGPDVGQQRLMPVALGPDLCSLDVGSLNFRGRIFLNPAEWVEEAAKRMRGCRGEAGDGSLRLRSHPAGKRSCGAGTDRGTADLPALHGRPVGG